ncbi:LysR family transcriptional regulator [Sporanaerobium hydrogeniformans]|uniref:LysR family transcriptional regulator n=1 Tax=Sporanaerobium hydrogeniformans TaxID=3072179 RepID=A0AC61DC69_9FIRM|nr:LysR family transcriptional regulator [Sporanaerobium hydrogeniformans]PHV70266.1 LysR family transcriptional regulator [Sporanaerobium hydrogeniformans]
MSQLHLYEIFYSVAEYKSFSKAADALYLSQPAISKAMKNLENTLDIKLFHRQSKGISLTPEGSVFYSHLQKAFEAIKAGETQLHKLKHLEDGHLKLGVSQTLGTHFLLPHLKDFIKKYPHIQLQLVNDLTHNTLSLVNKGDIDLAIVSSSTLHEQLHFISIEEIEDIFVCSPTYYQTIQNFSLLELCQNATFLFLSNESVTRLYIEKLLAEQGLHIIPDVIAGDMNFLIECAKLGLGITSVVKSFVEKDLEEGSLVEVNLSLTSYSRSIGMVYPKNTPLSLVAQTFINFILEKTASYKSSTLNTKRDSD